MSKTTKIVLWIVGVLVVLAGLGTFAVIQIADRFLAGPDEAAAIGQEIRPHQLPTDAEPIFGLDIFGLRLMAAAFDPQEEQVLMLMELPGEDFDTAAAEARTAFENQMGPQGGFEVVGSRDAVVGGESVTIETLLTTEGGEEVRQDLVVFPAASGNAAVAMLVGPVESFEEAAFDAFLDSMR